MRAVFAAAMLAVCAGSAWAQSGSWNFDGGGSWSTSGNWTGGIIPGNAAGDVVGLDNNITTSSTVTISGVSRTAGTLSIGDSDNTNAFNLASSGAVGLIFDNGGSGAFLIETGSVQDTASTRMTLADNLTVSVAGALAISGTIVQAGGVDGDPRSLTKMGPGSLSLTRLTNGYTGPTRILGGTLAIASISNGGFESPIGASGDEAENLVIDGGVLRYTGLAATTTRLFTIGTNGATLEFAGTGGLAFGDPVNDPGVVDLAVGLGGADAPRTLTLTGANTSTSNRVSYAITDNGTGSTSVTKSGVGVVGLAGNSTYTGITTVSQGRLLIYNPNALGATSGGTVISAGGQLRLEGIAVGNEPLTISGTGASGSEGALRVNSNSVTGDIGSVWGGTVTLAADATIFAGSGFTLTLDVPGSGTGTAIDLSSRTLQFTNSSDIEVKDNIIGTGGIAKRGSGALILSASTSYAGETIVTVGNISPRATGALGSTSRVTVVGPSGGSLKFQGGYNVGDRPLTISGDALDNVSDNNIYAGPVTVSANARIISTSGTLTLSNTITGSNAPITFSGNGTTLVSGNVGAGITNLNVNNYNFGNSPCLVIFTGSNPNYTGTVAVNDGSLQLGDGGTTGSFPTTVALTLGGSVGGSQALIVKRSNTVTQGVDFIGTAISGQGGFTQAGSGTTILNAVNTYKGPTKVLAGTLLINGDHTFNAPGQVTVASGATLGGTGIVGGITTIESGATLAPGASPGTLTFTQGLTLAAGGNYNWQILNATGTAGVTNGWDLVSVGGVLDVTATEADPFKINLWSLSSTGPDVNGNALNFNASQGYTWKIASATGGITNFSIDKFQVITGATNGTGGFTNSLSGGTFSLALSGSTDLNLVYTAGTPTVITINVASGTETQTQAGHPLLAGTIPVEKVGAGTVVFDQANTLTAPTTVTQGTLELAVADALSASAVTVAAGATLTVGPQVAAVVPSLVNNGLVDVGLGGLTVASGQTVETVVAGIVAGRSDGTWSGTSGITSSAAATQSERAVGWLNNGDGSFTVAFAAAGDWNVNGVVDFDDVLQFVSANLYDTGLPATWADGDFDYNGVVDFDDVLASVSAGLFDTGPYNTAPGGLMLMGFGDDPGLMNGGFTAVPEPTASALLAAGLAAWGLARRQRRSAGGSGQSLPA